MSYFVCLDLDHVKKDMPTKSGVFFLNGLTFHKHKMDALISQSTHYTQFIYEPNLIGEESPSEVSIQQTPYFPLKFFLVLREFKT